MNQDAKTKKRLTLDRETLKLLSPSDTAQVQGGLPREFSELKGCSLGGGVCTSGCPTTDGSGCCLF